MYTKKTNQIEVSLNKLYIGLKIRKQLIEVVRVLSHKCITFTDRLSLEIISGMVFTGELVDHFVEFHGTSIHKNLCNSGISNVSVNIELILNVLLGFIDCHVKLVDREDFRQLLQDGPIEQNSLFGRCFRGESRSHLHQISISRHGFHDFCSQR